MTSSPWLLALTVFMMLSGCVAPSFQDRPSESPPAPGKAPQPGGAEAGPKPIAEGLGDGENEERDKPKKDKDKKGDGHENSTLPPPIHDERDVFLGAGGAQGIGAECSQTRPCFDYPFKLDRTALLNVTASRTGPANGIAIEVLRGGSRVEFKSVSSVGAVTATVFLESVLDAADYVLRVHAFRMVAGRFVVDATFHEPPAPDPELGADPLLEQQWGLAMSRVPEAWAFATGRNATIAIIDTGIDLGHPDLRDKIVIVEGAVLAGTSLQAEDWHGTHVAGIAAASTHNGVGIAGVAPDARILPIRVVRTAGSEELLQPGFDDRFAKAIRLAAEHAQVISISVGNLSTSPHTAPQISDALEYAWSKGAVIVGAAGNGFVVPFCGGASSHPRVLCVGAVGKDGQRAADSQLEKGTLTGTKDFVVAPGGEPSTDCTLQVLSTVPPGAPGATCAQQHHGGWYAGMSGTSMATPFVAGVAALLVAQGLSNEEVVQRILGTADPSIGLEDALPDPNPFYGHGLVDAYCAVTNGAGDGCH